MSICDVRLGWVGVVVVVGLLGGWGPLDPEVNPAVATQPAGRAAFGESMVLVKARMNGGRSGDWMVDTGSSVSVVNGRLAEGARLPVAREVVRSLTPGGVIASPVRAVETLEFQGQVARNVAAVELDLDATSRGLGWSLDGVVGMNALGPAFRLDFSRSAYLAGEFENGTPGVTRAAWVEGSAVPVVWCRVNGKPCRLMIDTGTNETVVMRPEWVKANGVQVDLKPSERLLALSGRVDAMRAKFESVEVLGRKEVEVVGSVAPVPMEGLDGLVGVGILRKGILEVLADRRTAGMRWEVEGR